MRSSRMRPLSNGSGRRISTSKASSAAASGQRHRAAASAISRIAAAGNTGVPFDRMVGDPGQHLLVQMVEPMRQPDRAGGNRAAGGRRAGFPDRWLRPSCRTRRARVATDRAAAPRGSAAAVETRRRGQIVSGDIAARRDRRKRIAVAVVARQGWRGRGLRPPPRAARPPDRIAGSRWGRFRQRCDSPRRSARRPPRRSAPDA